ncbi:MAG: DUF2493 domain-containing protein [Alphaproteobacteria bacterium]|nr:DUF2493 domain-containing protein [Alphaproteobacteria bacterium]
MRTIIAGGRNYILNDLGVALLDRLRDEIPITAVVCGCATGIDTSGAGWAWQRGIPIIFYRADWDTYGKAAGMIRNAQMAANADACITFAGGAGTRNMRAQARAKGLKAYNFTKQEWVRVRPSQQAA